MKIVRATKNNLGEIAELFRVETAKKPYKQSWNKKTALMKVKELFRNQKIYIVVIDNKIVGFISVEVRLNSRGKSVHIDELWLKENFQGKGIGKKLIKFIEEKYKHKVKSLSLLSDKNSKAFGFYKKLNFKSFPEDVLMVKKIK